MSEQDKDQRSHEATPRRQEKLREEGKVARSADVGAAAEILTVLAVLAAFAQPLSLHITHFSRRVFRLQDASDPLMAVTALWSVLSDVILPVVALTAFVALAFGLLQTKGLFKLSLVAPKWERLNPASHIKKLLPGKESALEIGKQLLKIGVLALVVYRALESEIPMFSRLPAVAPAVAAAAVGGVVRQVALYGSAAFVAMAALDFWLARRKFQEESKMSNQELRDERKEDEGDPHLRRRMRQRMRELANRRAVSDVSKATVLVTNPTHVSVALRYDPEKDAAPIVIAKAVDKGALEMRTKARAHRVPIVENPPFARTLYRVAKIGKPIPVELYQLAAEVIAHVMRIRGGRA